MIASRAYTYCGVAVAALAIMAIGCDDPRDKGDFRQFEVGYRSGTEDDEFLSNGERGNILITEVNWAGAVREGFQGQPIHEPGEIFIELQNKNSRPVHVTDWFLIVTTGQGYRPRDRATPRLERPQVVYRIPERENRQPLQPNEYVVIATRLDGAYDNVDYVIEDLELPDARFHVTLRDVDNRLIESAGSADQDIFAGSFDLVTARSMERVQLIFANRGSREASWHTYSFNIWDEQHAQLTGGIRPAYKTFTYASPGIANSPDYSGNTSSGDFQ